MIDLIVPVYNNISYTKGFLESLNQQTFKDFSLIIIDNASSDGTKEFLSQFQPTYPITIITNQENLGYVKAVNQGLQYSDASFVFLGNNDTILPENLLENLIKFNGDFGIVSALSNAKNPGDPNPLLIDYLGSSQYEEINTFALALGKQSSQVKLVDFVFGHCMFIKRKVIEKIGLLDERFGIGNYDDQDFCKRAREAGFKIGLLQNAFIYHFCHTTFKTLGVDIDDLLKENFTLFQRKWQ